MKKSMLIKLMCAALSILMVVSLSACKGDKKTSGKSEAGSNVDMSKYKGANIVMFCAADGEDTIKGVLEEAGKKWEEDTGGKVTYIMNSDWNQRYTRLTTLIATGEQLDTYGSTVQDCPNLPFKGLFLPVDEYVEETDYISEYLSKEAYTYNGKVYGFAQKCRSVPIVLLYNKTMFENNGVKTPLEYYEEGNWNWNTFRDLAKEMTMDLDNDGKTDQYGYGSWLYQQFFASSGYKDYIGSDNKLVFGESAFAETLQYIQDMTFKDKSVNGGDWKTAFCDGKVAMGAERSYYVQNLVATGCLDEVDFVPFPQNPNNKSDINYMYWVDGMSVLSNTKNIDAAAIFIKNYYTPAYHNWYEEFKLEDEFWQGGYTEQQQKFIDELVPHASCFPSFGYPDFDSKMRGLITDVTQKGTSVSTAIATHQGILQAIVDDTLKSE